MHQEWQPHAKGRAIPEAQAIFPEAILYVLRTRGNHQKHISEFFMRSLFTDCTKFRGRLSHLQGQV